MLEGELLSLLPMNTAKSYLLLSMRWLIMMICRKKHSFSALLTTVGRDRQSMPKIGVSVWILQMSPDYHFYVPIVSPFHSHLEQRTRCTCTALATHVPR